MTPGFKIMHGLALSSSLSRSARTVGARVTVQSAPNLPVGASPAVPLGLPGLFKVGF